MKPLIFSTLLIICLFLLSCEKNYPTYNSITGQWQWLESTAGKVSITSESVDSTYYIEFDNNGGYYVYDNSKKVISTAKYELKLQENSDMYRIINDTQVGFYSVFKVSSDTLTITNLEGFIKWTSYYLRIK